MKSLSLLALLVSTTFMSTAFAGAGSSGGGNALVCFDNPSIPKQIRERDGAGNIVDGSIRNEHISHIKSIEVLDLVEARFQRGLNPKSLDLIPLKHDEEIEEYAERIIERLKNVAPELYDLLSARLKKMPASEAIAQPDGLYPVDDYNLLGRIDSTNCVVATVALHQIINETYPLNYDQRLMFHPRHSDLSKAVTYLHEIIYSVGRTNFSHKGSQDTRKLMGVLLRKDVSVEDLKTILESSSFHRSSWNISMLGNYNFSKRSDRLGKVYKDINLNVNIVLDNYRRANFSKIGKLQEQKLEVKLRQSVLDIKKVLPELECNTLRECEEQLRKIVNSPRFRSKELVKKAQELLKKYNDCYGNSDRESEREAKFEVYLGAKDVIKDAYEKYDKENLLSISNISTENLKKLDAAIEDAIENSMPVIIKYYQSYDERRFYESGFFGDTPVEKILNEISMQTKL